MPSMGALGAIAGGANALGDVIKGDIEEARKTRLENLRTSNNQATNSLNNKERHGYSMDEKAKGQEYTLAELAQRQDNAKDLSAQGATEAQDLATHQSTLRTGEPTNEMKDAEYWRNEGGVDPAQQYQDNQKSGSRGWGGSGLPADAKMMNYLMTTMNMDKEQAQAFVREKSETSPAEFRRNLLVSFVDAGLSSQEAATEVEAMMQMAYPEEQNKPNQPAPAPGGPGGGDDDNWPAPRPAADGYSYIKKNGKMYRVK